MEWVGGRQGLTPGSEAGSIRARHSRRHQQVPRQGCSYTLT
jgi:hypothetical protein